MNNQESFVGLRNTYFFHFVNNLPNTKKELSAWLA